MVNAMSIGTGTNLRRRESEMETSRVWDGDGGRVRRDFLSISTIEPIF